ncbi:low specificity L-threonine aldolase [Oscillatoria sp. CS-180]|uniref:threonine aldolase family protein n=1 Tax=Oscillatoria sp. CS-180 TaxID=3021720 RepID=UPI00232F7B16|nr:low specificity L-threonine aldolase [Oscillatoria sp. CS-180]MDB9528803.1 low specificity L-threonine aldolase [Oscillatoria sp. CS-180]
MLEQFASDNYSGMCPEAIAALLEANQGHAVAYGDDPWTQQAADRLREIFETDCEVFFVFSGTAANSLALSSLCQSFHSVICHELSHIETDECGAPEFFSNGAKLLLGSGQLGKLTPDTIADIVLKRGDIHYPKPKVISLTQPTEVGTLYSLEELAAIRATADHHSLRIHMDGARFANAIAALNCSPADMTWKQGVDVLCFGGTKNGLAAGEAVIFFNKALAEDFDYRCKQAGHLASKMRFIAAPLLGALTGEAWLDHARHANACAAYLADQLAQIPGLKLLFPQSANGVFVEMPEHVIQALYDKGWKFYTFIGDGGARFMCSWNTTRDRIDDLLADIKAVN